MTYVVTENCIKCKFMDCVKVCLLPLASGVRVGGYREKALEHLGEPLRNATDLEPDHV